MESFASIASDLAKLFPLHWQELALFKDRIPLCPQYHEYVARDEAGKLFVVTGRWDGRIVSYYIAQVMPGFHYETTLTATGDIAYVTSDVRDRGLALPMFRLVEKELRRRKTKVWYSGYKTDNDMGMPRLLTALKFQPADTYMVKWLGE